MEENIPPANMPSEVEKFTAPLIIVGIAVVTLFALSYFGIVKIPIEPIQQQVKKIAPKQEPKVSLQTKYDNPFDKKAQYVNPFGQKNPFDQLK